MLEIGGSDPAWAMSALETLSALQNMNQLHAQGRDVELAEALGHELGQHLGLWQLECAQH